MQFWLVTTDHLTDRLWFKDDEDFKAGMNIPPVLAASMSVNILSFILMSNHVHFVLACNQPEAETFINRFKKLYSQRYSKKYGSQSLLLNNGIDIRELFLDGESLEKGIAYVQMNCVGANISLNPADYPWGTGNAFFRVQSPKGTRVGDMGVRELRRYLHSRLPIPVSYMINDNGFVDPASYVNVTFVESLFRTPKRMNYFLRNSSKAKLIREAPSFGDQVVLSGMKSLCLALFRKPNISDLQESEQSELLKQIRYRFSADPGQMTRVSGISYETVCRLLDSV